MCFPPENLNLFLFHPLSFCEQNTHTHTHKRGIFPLSFSVFLSIFRKRKTHTHAQKNSLVMFCFLSFLWYSPLSSALAFIICLFVSTLLLFLFCESYMLLLHCRHKGYNANKIPNTEYHTCFQLPTPGIALTHLLSTLEHATFSMNFQSKYKARPSANQNSVCRRYRISLNISPPPLNNSPSLLTSPSRHRHRKNNSLPRITPRGADCAHYAL